jgi:outer membrane cobalamin receptor
MTHKPLVALLLLLPWGLAAQTSEQDDSNPFFIQTTVVVTATREEPAADKAPAFTSVVTRQDWQARNVRLADQALNLLPGLFASRSKGPADTLAGVGMRGFPGRSAEVSGQYGWHDTALREALRRAG